MLDYTDLWQQWWNCGPPEVARLQHPASLTMGHADWDQRELESNYHLKATGSTLLTYDLTLYKVGTRKSFSAQGPRSLLSSLLGPTCQWWAGQEAKVGWISNVNFAVVQMLHLQLQRWPQHDQINQFNKVSKFSVWIPTSSNGIIKVTFLLEEITSLKAS